MDPIFDASRPTYILGGGPSLASLYWEAMDGMQTVAVNLAYRKLPTASAVFFADAQFYRRHADPDPASDFRRYEGDHLFSTSPQFDGANHPRITFVSAKSLTLGAFSAAKCNSGVQAAVLAKKLGAGDVILLGFDNVPGHWAAGLPYAHPGSPNPSAYKLYQRQLAELLAADPTIRLGTAVSDPELFN